MIVSSISERSKYSEWKILGVITIQKLFDQYTPTHRNAKPTCIVKRFLLYGELLLYKIVSVYELSHRNCSPIQSCQIKSHFDSHIKKATP